MAFILGKGFVDLDMETSKFDKKVKKTEDRLKAFSGKLKKFSSGAKKLLLGISAVGFFSVREGIARQDAIANMEASFVSMGNRIGMTSKEVQEFAKEINEATGVGKTELFNMMAQVMTFGNISDKMFKRTSRVVVDLAAKMKGDLKGAMMQVSKAMEDPLKGMAQLAESGVSFTIAEQKLIKELMAANDLLGAQEVIMKKLETQMGGTAESMNKGVSKSVNKMQEAFKDIGNSLTDVFAPALKNLAKTMKQASEVMASMSDKQKSWLEVILKWGGGLSIVTIGVAGLVSVIGFVARQIKSIIGVSKAGAAAITAVGTAARNASRLAGIKGLMDSLNKPGQTLEGLQAAHEAFKKTGKSAGVLTNMLNKLWAVLTEKRNAFAWIRPTLKYIWTGIKTVTGVLKKLIIPLNKLIISLKVLPLLPALLIAITATLGLMAGAFIKSIALGESYTTTLKRLGDGIGYLKDRMVDNIEQIKRMGNVLGGVFEEDADSVGGSLRFRLEKARQRLRKLIKIRKAAEGGGSTPKEKEVKLSAELLKMLKEEVELEKLKASWAYRKLKIDERAKMLMAASTQAARDFRRYAQEGAKAYLSWRRNLLKTQADERKNSGNRAFDRMREILEARKKDAEDGKKNNMSANALVSVAQAFTRLSTASPEQEAHKQRKKTNEELVLIRHGQEDLVEEFRKNRNFDTVFSQ